MAMSQESYERWRSSIPFSDAAIAAALEAEALDLEVAGKTFWANRLRHRAARVLQGRVCSGDLRYSLGRLVTLCNVCGKTALYRYGNEGRCRKHKDDVPQVIVRQRMNYAAKHASFQADLQLRDQQQKAVDRLRLFDARRRQGHK